MIDESHDDDLTIVSVSVGSNPTPQLLKSQRATQRAWMRIEQEFGFLTDSQITELLGANRSNRAPLSTMRSDNEILGVLRGCEYRYPAFQFDRGLGAVLPIIPSLIRLAHENKWSDQDVVLWLQGPTTSFELEDRHVDHLRTDPDLVIAAAKEAFGAEW
jgi:hypothetical protein